MIETLIGQRYRIKALIGEGGMASVYLALDEKLERKVAIKIMHPHLARNVDIRERFLLEARTVSGLDHPNILRVYDFSGLDSEQLWIVMEILYGEDLSEYVKAFPRHRLQFIVATLITREICRALHEAHKLNIVHRDIKPENIMMLQNGQLKLMDFGIAKVHRANATQTGIFMGSPSYMSPEQIRGTDVDSRADIYSLAVLFYEIITGQLPFVGKSTAEVINRIMVGRYSAPNLLVTELPPPLNSIITKGLQHQKEERFQTITEMALALDNFLASVNFRESRIELEEFTLNRTKFEERVAEVLTVPPTALNVWPPDEISEAFRSKVTRYQASYETPVENPTMILDGQDLPTLPPMHPGKTVPPPMPPGIQPKYPQLNLNEPERAVVSSDPSKKSARSDSSSKSGRSKQTSVPPSSGKPSSSKNSGNFSSPMRSPTHAPRTPTQGKSTHRAVYREFLEEEKKKTSNLSLIVAILIAVSAAFFFFATSDRFSSSRTKMITKGAETVGKSKRKNDKEAEASPPNGTTQTNSDDDNSETKTASEDPAAQPSAQTPDLTPVPSEPAPVATPTPQETNRPQPVKPKPQTTVSRPKPTPPVKTAQETKPVTPPPVQKPKDTVLASIPVEKTPEDKVPEKPSLPGSATDKDKTKPAPTGPGMLRLAALPAAEVYLDGKMYGTTNDKQFGSQGIKLDPGTYMLRLKRKGYRTEEQAIQIKPGEMRQINVSLQKLAEFVELSIRVNKLPATVTIEEVKNGGRKREMPMLKHILPVNLKPGSYKVNVSHEGESINRTLELTEENKSITFNADFK